MFALESNTLQLIGSTVADGTRVAAAQGTSLTPGNNTYGSYAAILSALSDDTYWIEININSGATAAAARDMLVTIGVDPAGGTSYTDTINHLLGSCASAYQSGSTPCGGIWYRFPLRIRAGSTVAAKASVNNATVGTVSVAMKAWGRPSRPELVRVGSFVRTFGETTASSRGTTVTPGGASEGSYVQLGSALAESLWYWEFGLGVNSGTMVNAAHEVDIAVGDASNKKIVISNGLVLECSAESIAKLPNGAHGSAVSGDLVYGRIQTGPGNAAGTVSLIAYGCGG